MDAFELDDLIRSREDTGRPYLEFLRSEALSAGLYELPASGTDRQQPHAEDEVYAHAEDEVYVVMRGRATIRVGDEDSPVAPGSVVFVAAGVEHRFHDIEEDLAVLVVFAPPES